MLAPNRYLTSLRLAFSTFLTQMGVGMVESKAALELLAKLVNQKQDVNTWSPQETEEFVRKEAQKQPQLSPVGQKLVEFVSQYPPLQTTVFLHEFLLALKADGCSNATVRNYRSDISQFLAFAAESQPELAVTKPKVTAFVSYQRQKGLQTSSVERKLKTLNQFAQWLVREEILTQNPLANYPEYLSEKLAALTSFIEEIRPNQTQNTPIPPIYFTPQEDRLATARKHQERRAVIKSRLSELSHKVRHQTKQLALGYLNLALMVLFFLGLAGLGYQTFFQQVEQNLAYPTSLIPPNRTLSFQGRLTDSAQNPVTGLTDFTFILYDNITGGTAIWTSDTCTIQPDQDGIFNVGLGSAACGPALDEDVFSKYSNVWLEVGVEGETLTPRQPIRTVPYALNSETLQGYPASASAVENTILVMDNNGDVNLGSLSPVLRSTSGTFSIEAQTLQLTTASGSNGDIILSPDGLGTVTLQKYLEAPGATISATYATGTAFTVNGSSIFNGTGADFDFLVKGNTDDDLLFVDAGNDLVQVGKLNINGEYTLPTLDGDANYIMQTDGSGTVNWVDPSGAASSAIYWTLGNSNLTLHPKNALYHDLAIGGTATPSGTANDAKFYVEAVTGNATTSGNLTIGQGKQLRSQYGPLNLAYKSGANAWTTGMVLNEQGYVGIGTTAPTVKLDVSGTASFSGTLAFRGTTADPKIDVLNGKNLGFRTSVGGGASLTEMMTITNGGNIGIGTTSPTNKLHISSNTSSEGIMIDNFASTPAPSLIFRAGQGTAASPTALQINDTLGGLSFRGMGATALSSSGKALLKVGAAETWTDSAQGTFFAFETTAVGGTTRSEKVRIDSTGNVGLGTTSPTASLHVYGDYSNNAAAVIDQRYSGDILTASASGTTKFKISNAGVLTLANSSTVTDDTTYTRFSRGLAVGSDETYYFSSAGVVNASSLGINGEYTLPTADGTTNYVMKTDGSGGVTWVDANSLISGGTGSNWSITAGVLHPKNITTDLVIGGTATASARFHVNAATGDASASGNLTVGNGGQFRSAFGPLNLAYKSGANAWTTGMVINEQGYVGIGTTAPGAKLQINTGADATIGQIIKANSATQTGNLTEWQNSSGTVLASVLADGRLFVDSSLATANGSGAQLRIKPTANVPGIVGAQGRIILTSGTPAMTQTFENSPAALLANVNFNMDNDVTEVHGLRTIASKGVGTGIITTLKQIDIESPIISGGSVTNNYGLFINSQSAGTSLNYSIYTNLGNVSFGDDVLLHNDSDRIQIGAGGDLDLYHDGTNSYINNITGDLVLENDASNEDISFKVNDGGVDTTAMTVQGSTGRVGIGTTSPASKLQINNGQLRIVDNGTGNTWANRTDSILFNRSDVPTTYTNKITNSFSGTAANTSMNFELTTAGGSTFSNVLTLLGNGDVGVGGAITDGSLTGASLVIKSGFVGIGSTSPSGKLDVVGALGTVRIDTNGNNLLLTRAGANYIRASDAIGTLYLGAGGNTDDLSIQADHDVVISNGNVGIGTTAPTSPLHVYGAYSNNAAAIIDQRNSGDILAASASGTTKFKISNAGVLTLANGSTVTDDTTYARFSRGLAFGADETYYINSSGTANINALTAASTTTFGGITYTWPGTQAGSNLILTNDGTGGLDWTDVTSMVSAGTSKWSITAGTIHPNNSTLDFLIGGTASTSAKFWANATTGDASASGNLTVGNGGQFRSGYGPLNLAYKSGANAWTTGLTLNEQGNIGLGTTTPGGKLHVYSGASGQSTPFTDTDDLVIESSGNTGLTLLSPNDSVQRIIFGDNDSAARGFIVYNHNTDSLGIGANGSDGGHVYIDSSGNVGIGNAPPTAKLDVAGSASLSGTLALRGTTDPKIDVLNGENFGIRTSLNGDAGLTERLTVLNNGNVGIGTTIPGYKLHTLVSTAGTANTMLVDQTDNTSGTSNAGLWLRTGGANGGDARVTYTINGAQDWVTGIDNSDEDKYKISTSGTFATSFLTINTTGLVGIGTTAPTSPLHIYAQYADNAAAVIDQRYSGDILAASASGTTRMRVSNAGDLYLPGDNQHLYLGAGNDLDLSHNGADSIIKTLTGNLIFQADGDTDDYLYLSSDGTDLSLVATADSDLSMFTDTDFYIHLDDDADGTNEFAIKDSDNNNIFTVSETKITSSLPHEFLASGDVSMSYDLNFTNQSQSYITSVAPLYIQVGESFENNDLTLQTYGTGNVIIDSQALVTNQAASISSQLLVGTTTNPENIGSLYVTNASTYGKALAMFNQTEGADILTASASGVNKFSISSAGALTLAGGSIVTDDTTYARFSRGIAFGANETYYINSSGTANLNGLSLAGALDLNGDISIADTDIVFDGASTNFSITGNFSINTDDLFIEKATGNVGIGTTAPTAPLHVYGAYSNNAAMIIDQRNSGDIFVASASGTTRFKVDNNGYTYSQRFVDLANSANFLDPAATDISLTVVGDVGIGTTTPATDLDVRQTTDGRAAVAVQRQTDSSPTGNLMTFNNAAGGVLTSFGNYGQYTGMAFMEDWDTYYDSGNWYIRGLSGGATRIGSALNQNIELYPQGTGDVLIRNGYLGIGTTTPDYALQVNGEIVPEATDLDLGTTALRWDLLANTINADSTVTLTGLGTGIDNSVVILNSSNQLTTDEIDARVWGSTLVDGSGATNHVALWSDTNTLMHDSGALYWDATDNQLGIGNSTMRAELDVTGDASISGRLFFTGSLASINMLDGQDFTIGTSGGGEGNVLTRLTMSAGGNFGIGTTSTTHTLNLGTGSIQAANMYGHTDTRIDFIGDTGVLVQLDDDADGNNSFTVWDSTDNPIFQVTEGGMTDVDDITGGATFDLKTTGAANFYLDTDNNGANAFRIYNGDGTTVEFEVLEASGNTSVNGRLSVGSFTETSTEALCFDGADANGFINDCLTSVNPDIGEMYPSTPDTNPGDVLVIRDDGQGSYVGVKSNEPYSPHILGVVSTAPTGPLGDVMGDSVPAEKNPRPVGLSGRVPVKVSLENGPIAVGDPLTTSSTPGVAMKAIQAGSIIGKALEAYDGSVQVSPDSRLHEQIRRDDPSDADLGPNPVDPPPGIGKIMSFINIGYYNPDFAIDSTGHLNLTQLPNGEFEVTYNESTLQKIGGYARLLVANLEAGLIRTQKLIVQMNIETPELKTDLISPLTGNDVEIDLGQSSSNDSAQLLVKNVTDETVFSVDDRGNTSMLGQLLTQSASVSGDATVSGTLYVNQIDAESSRLTYLEGKVADLEHIKATTAELITATISGTLYANDIADFENKVASALQAPSLLNQILGTQDEATESASVAQLFNIIDSAGFSASGSGSVNKTLEELNLSSEDVAIGASAAFINTYFEVNGSAYIANSLGLGQQLLIGEGMVIGDGVINMSATATNPEPTLYLQPSGQGSINLLAGAMVINQIGQVSITGDLHVAGSVKVEQTLLADLLQPTDFGNPFQVQVVGISTESGEITESRFEIVNELGAPVATISAQGKATFAGGLGVGAQDLTASVSGDITTDKTSGRAVVRAGTSEVIVFAKNLTADSLVYVTPIGSTQNQVLYVKQQSVDNPVTPDNEAQFTVGFDTALTQDVTFNWWIVN